MHIRRNQLMLCLRISNFTQMRTTTTQINVFKVFIKSRNCIFHTFTQLKMEILMSMPYILFLFFFFYSLHFFYFVRWERERESERIYFPCFGRMAITGGVFDKRSIQYNRITRCIRNIHWFNFMRFLVRMYNDDSLLSSFFFFFC